MSYIRRDMVWTRQCGLRIVQGQTCLCVGAGKWQVNDGLCADVPLWCASEPVARRRIDLVCLEAFWLQEWEWVLEDCHKRSCWKNPIGMSAPGPYRSDVYVCSKSCRLCLTVVYWLLECNKVPSWIEPEYVTIYYLFVVVHFEGVRLYLWTTVTNGPSVHPSDDKLIWSAKVE
jgi:hypothetical protein